MMFAHFCRIESQLIGDLVHLDFLSPSGLGSAMPALGTAGCLVGKDSNGFETIVRQCVGRGLKDARIKSTRHTMSTVRSAVEYRPMMHGSNGSILFVSNFGRHQNGMTAAMTIKDLLTRQTNFHGTACDHRQFAHNNLVVERIALASKSAAIRSCNHADMTCGHLEDFRQMPV